MRRAWSGKCSSGHMDWLYARANETPPIASWAMWPFCSFRSDTPSGRQPCNAYMRWFDPDGNEVTVS